MKAIICKKEYDTDTAVLIKKHTSGWYGDPAGYEETLYQTPDGFYFLYCFGGSESPYTCETIRRIARTRVDAWIETH